MPNHAHMLLIIYGKTNVKNMPQRFQPHMLAMMEERHPELKEPYEPVELWKIIKIFKAASSRLIRVSGAQDFGWQHRYWHEVVWNNTRLETLRTYIRDNPRTWERDKLYIPPKP